MYKIYYCQGMQEREMNIAHIGVSGLTSACLKSLYKFVEMKLIIQGTQSYKRKRQITNTNCETVVQVVQKL